MNDSTNLESPGGDRAAAQEEWIAKPIRIESYLNRTIIAITGGSPIDYDQCGKFIKEAIRRHSGKAETPLASAENHDQTQNTLLPCPFCGELPNFIPRTIFNATTDIGKGFWVWCKTQGCPSFDRTVTEARWNQRAAVEQSVDQVSEKRTCGHCGRVEVTYTPPISEDKEERIAQLERQVQGFIELEDQCYDVLDRLGFEGHILDKVCLARDEIKRSRSGPGEIHGRPRPRIHNKKMLDAIEGVIIEHSGNGLLAQEVRQFISAEDSSSPAALIHPLRLSDRLEGSLREEWRKFLTCRPDFDILCGPEVSYRDVPAGVESDENKLTGGYQPYPYGRMTERDHMVAAELIQWLGSPVGFAFLSGALDRAGWKIKPSPAVEDVGEVEEWREAIRQINLLAWSEGGDSDFLKLRAIARKTDSMLANKAQTLPTAKGSTP